MKTGTAWKNNFDDTKKLSLQSVRNQSQLPENNMNAHEHISILQRVIKSYFTLIDKMSAQLCLILQPLRTVAH